MLKNTSTAYDFSLFEPTKKEKERTNQTPSRNKSKKVIKLTQEQLYKSRRRKYKPLSVISVILSSFMALYP